MIALLSFSLAIVVVLELARRLPLLASFRRLGHTSSRALRAIGRRHVLEKRKERALQQLSLRMLAQSLHAGLLLALVAAPIGVVLLLDGPLGLGTVAGLGDWSVRLPLLGFSLSYAVFRNWFSRSLQRI